MSIRSVLARPIKNPSFLLFREARVSKSRIRYYSKFSKLKLAQQISTVEDELLRFGAMRCEQSVTTKPSNGVGIQHFAQTYERRRQRTKNLVEIAIQELQRAGKRISLRNVESATKRVDPSGKGISRKGIIGNPDAYNSYRVASNRLGQAGVLTSIAYERVTKDTLIERLILLKDELQNRKQVWVDEAAVNWNEWASKNQIDFRLVTYK